MINLNSIIDNILNSYNTDGGTNLQENYIYPIPYEYYEKYGIRRYGFHGTSHKYISNKACEFLGEDIKNLKIITCHLGNGASVSAVDHGKCVDTSMGLTPLEGLIMGTRSGDMDPAVVQTIANGEGISVDEFESDTIVYFPVLDEIN